MHTPARDPIEEQAIRWRVRRGSGEWSELDQAALDAWLVSDECHHKAYARVTALWQTAGHLPHARLRTPTSTRRLRRAAAGLTLAAAVLLSLGPAMQTADRWWNGESVTVATTRGEHRQIDLPDGSVVVLGGASEFAYRIGHTRRDTRLAHGEALFTVSHDSARPFTVEAGAGQIEDLGTQFDVDVQASHVHVTVLEGKVALSSGQAPRQGLSAGQAGGYGLDGTMLPVTPGDEVVVAWRKGSRVFRDESLAEAIEHLRRDLPLDIEIGSPTLGKLRISGRVRFDDPDAFLATLQRAFPLRLERDTNGRVLLLPRAD